MFAEQMTAPEPIATQVADGLADLEPKFLRLRGGGCVCRADAGERGRDADRSW